jgi:hypothetical protein
MSEITDRYQNKERRKERRQLRAKPLSRSSVRSWEWRSIGIETIFIIVRKSTEQDIGRRLGYRKSADLKSSRTKLSQTRSTSMFRRGACLGFFAERLLVGGYGGR